MPLFGRDCFLNEIIWAYDYGARTTKRWPAEARHDPGLRQGPGGLLLRPGAVDREPYMAPGLVDPREAGARASSPTDGWWHTIVPTTGGSAPARRPRNLRGCCGASSRASSAPGDWVLDFFAGSGTTGAVAAQLGRRFLLVDESADAIATMRARLPSGTAFALTGAGRQNRRMVDRSSIGCWLTDMDGVLVHENTPVPGAAELLQQWRDRGNPYLVLTNNSIFTPRDLQRTAARIRPDRARGVDLDLGAGHRRLPRIPDPGRQRLRDRRGGDDHGAARGRVRDDRVRPGLRRCSARPATTRSSRSRKRSA